MARGVHDLGGLPAGPVDREEHAYTLFDKRVDAMMKLLTHPSRAIYTVDAMRRVNEGYSAEMYFGKAYYSRWLECMRKLLVERHVLTDAEIEQRVAAVKARKGAAS
jgi:hypothetical protein